MRLPRFVVGAASSGAGKTSLALGILGALKDRGLDARPFKIGPDYIDPGLHRARRGQARP
jgi:cobyrinic acid a,c-diamide synthase